LPHPFQSIYALDGKKAAKHPEKNNDNHQSYYKVTVIIVKKIFQPAGI